MVFIFVEEQVKTVCSIVIISSSNGVSDSHPFTDVVGEPQIHFIRVDDSHLFACRTTKPQNRAKIRPKLTLEEDPETFVLVFGPVPPGGRVDWLFQVQVFEG